MRLRSFKSFFVALGVLLVWVTPVGAFDCSPTYCSKMSTCAEAYYKFEVCGHVKRDRNGNGVPCENLCGTSIKTYLARARAQWPKDIAFVARRTRDVAPALISPAQADEPVELGEAEDFSCRGKRTCKQMLTCAEARFYLRTCRVRSLDGNGDGIPCNSLCR